MENNESNETIIDSTETNEQVGEETTKETPSEPKPEKPKRTPEEELSYFEGRAKRLRKELGLDTEQKKDDKKSDELDYGQQAYLSVKGIESDEEIALVKSIMSETGKSLKDVVSSKYFQAELKDRREERATQDAVPKSTRRSAQSPKDDLAVALAEYKKSGTLPENFELRSKILDEVTKSDPSKNPFQ